MILILLMMKNFANYIFPMKKRTDWKKKYYNLRKRFLKLKEENDKNSRYAYRYLEVAGLINRG
jgi:hypothetical protein